MMMNWSRSHRRTFACVKNYCLNTNAKVLHAERRV